MIEILATDVQHEHQARHLLATIEDTFPGYRANFDLEDCDRILRIVNPCGAVDTGAVIELMEACGFNAEVLPDLVANASTLPRS